MKRACLIGAGSSGIAVAKALRGMSRSLEPVAPPRAEGAPAAAPPMPAETVEPPIEVELEAEPEAEPEEDILGVAEAREKLLAAVAALEQPALEPESELSQEEAEARALAEAIEAERREFED